MYMLDDRTSRKMPGGTCPCKSGTGHASAECTHTVSDLDKADIIRVLQQVHLTLAVTLAYVIRTGFPGNPNLGGLQKSSVGKTCPLHLDDTPF